MLNTDKKDEKGTDDLALEAPGDTESPEESEIKSDETVALSRSKLLMIKKLLENIGDCREKNGQFLRNEYGYPAAPNQPGYSDAWKRRLIEDTGDKLEVR